MSTSGTHITIVQRLAASDKGFRKLLGDPMAEETTVEGQRARFANLGAVGPDVFYASADYGADMQDLQDFLMKTVGMFACLSEIMEKMNAYVSGVESVITRGVTDFLKESAELIMGVLKNGLMAFSIHAGVNLRILIQNERSADLDIQNSSMN